MYGFTADTASRGQKSPQNQNYTVVSHHVGMKIKHRASEEWQVLLTTEPCIQLQQIAREYRFSKSTYHV